ncbi:reverse transcriptase [Cucumis melo var. makuwa]|uniref:Reverse transcriptase n=1 Tax=Cucumis melo var. makuwa TaxID=1194695 RepID=A0A5A7U403_CUCMM|nr:reverse transcriptase [Cucumis melo var. makuwa]
MSSVNPSGKAQKDRLAELEEQMLYLVEVPDSIRYLESRLDEISEKTDAIDAVVGRLEALLIQELLARVVTLETNISVERTVNYERGDSSSGFATHMEERVSELDCSQKTLLEMINDMSKDFRVTLDVVRNEIADVNARMNLMMRAMANQAPTVGAISYFKATNTVTEEAKVTLATTHLSEDAKLWWRSRYVDIQEGRCTIDTWDTVKRELRSQFFPENKDKVFCFVEGLKPWARVKLYEQRIQDLASAYAAAERLFDLTSDSQDVRHHQSSSPGRNRNSHPSSPKAVRETNVLVKTADLTSQTQRTHGKGRIIGAHPSVPSVVSYVGSHIWQENARIKLTSMRFRPH